MEKITPIKQAVIDATAYVGIKTITAKNAEMFFKRLAIYRGTFGGKHTKITLADVKDNIGLTTSATNETDTQFRDRVWSAWVRLGEDKLNSEKDIEAKIKAAIVFILNSMEHCSTRANAYDELTRVLQCRPLAERILDLWQGLHIDQRIQMQKPERNDATLRAWLSAIIRD